MNDKTVSHAFGRTLAAAVIIAVAVHLTQSRDVMVDFTRPLVVGVLHLLHIPSADRGDSLAVGELHIPWTRDCAGINLLIILLGLAVWVNRHEARASCFWWRLVGMVPAALLANVLRVLTLIGYRTLAYPGVESPQTHYFMGFFWLAPFVALITPKDQRPPYAALMETLHASAVIALLATMVGTPNAWLLSVAVVVCLAQSQLRTDYLRQRLVLFAMWLLLGAAIALVSMESFWMPWLLVCPLFLDVRWFVRGPGALCVGCSHTLVVMQPWVWPLVAVAAGLAWAYKGAVPGQHMRRVCSVPRWARVVFVPALALPFLASTVLSLGLESWSPPSGVTALPIRQNGYEIRLPGQSASIGLACYVAAGRDRHHTVKVCLKYRGVDVTQVAESAGVSTDGKHWLREYFLQEGELLSDYGCYVESTFRPWASPGVHLIFISPQERLSPSEFAKACDLLAQDFASRCRAATAPEKPKLAQGP